MLDRGFIDALPSDARNTLRSLIRDLKLNSREVNASLTEFARGLRRYVLSQEFQRDRAMRDALHEALSAASSTAQHVKPTQQLEEGVELSALPIRSVGAVVTHDPAEFDATAPLADADHATADLEHLAALARESEIDFAELINNVNEALAAASPASVGDVLALNEATQGLASIVGLLSLAWTHGHVDQSRTESLNWHGNDHVERTAVVHVHQFSEAIK